MWPKTQLSYDPNRPTDVDLWLSRTAMGSEILHLLSEDEQEKASQLTLQSRREEYITTRAIQRHALARFTGLSPQELAFEKGPYNKPSHPLAAFNLSNCKGLVACAIAKSELGLDIEPHDRGHQAYEVASRVYTDREREDLALLATPERNKAAIELWTLKEAVMKASGMGFQLDPQSFELSQENGELKATSQTTDLGGNWHLTLTILASGHAMSLATSMPRPNIRIHHFPTPYRLGLNS